MLPVTSVQSNSRNAAGYLTREKDSLPEFLLDVLRGQAEVTGRPGPAGAQPDRPQTRRPQHDDMQTDVSCQGVRKHDSNIH